MPGNSASLPSPPTAPHARWEATQGGLMEGSTDCARAAAAFERITIGLSRAHLSIHVLNSPSPAAFSFPDGSIYVARGLADRLTDDELAASIAHELGHLLHDGIITAPAALRGGYDGDIERIADLLGRELLIAHHMPPAALPSALQKVADASRNTCYFPPIKDRVAYLHSLDAAQ